MGEAPTAEGGSLGDLYQRARSRFGCDRKLVPPARGAAKPLSGTARDLGHGFLLASIGAGATGYRRAPALSAHLGRDPAAFSERAPPDSTFGERAKEPTSNSCRRPLSLARRQLQGEAEATAKWAGHPHDAPFFITSSGAFPLCLWHLGHDAHVAGQRLVRGRISAGARMLSVARAPSSRHNLPLRIF